MASEQYVIGVMEIARVVFADERWRASVAAGPAGDTDLSDVEVELAVPGDSLSAALAGQSLVKAGFDAAILATWWATEGGDPDDLGLASEIIDRHVGAVVFTSLEFGSFLARYRLDPRTELGRQRVFAILAGLGVALQYVSVLFPPAALPVLIVGTALAAPQILTSFFMAETDAAAKAARGTGALLLDLGQLPPGTLVTITVPDDDPAADDPESRSAGGE